MKAKRDLIWIDGMSGLVAGCLMVALARPLGSWYRFDHGLILKLASVNFLYAAYALTLARAKRRPLPAIHVLAAANFAWGLACFALAVHLWAAASVLGLGHLFLEGGYVAALATLEWRARHRLVSPDESPQA